MGAAAAGPFGFCCSTIIKLSSLLAGNSTAADLAAEAANGPSSAEVGFKGRAASAVGAAGLADGSGTAGFVWWPLVAGSGILGAGATGFGCSFGITGSGLATGVGTGAGTSTLGLAGSTIGLGTSTGLVSGTGAGLGGAGLSGASTLGWVGTWTGFGGCSTGLGRSSTPEGFVAGPSSTGLSVGLGSTWAVLSDSGSQGSSTGLSVRAGLLLEISLPVKNIKIRLIKPKRFLKTKENERKLYSEHLETITKTMN